MPEAVLYQGTIAAEMNAAEPLVSINSYALPALCSTTGLFQFIRKETKVLRDRMAYLTG